MIDFKELTPRIDLDIIEQIRNNGNSGHVVTCYVLSLIYGFKFDVDEFKSVGLNTTDKTVQDWAKKRGISHIAKPNGMAVAQCHYSNFDVLCKNDICLTVSGTNTTNNAGHSSIVRDFAGDTFVQLFCNPNNSITKLSQVTGLYMTFYYKDCDISKFVQITNTNSLS